MIILVIILILVSYVFFIYLLLPFDKFYNKGNMSNYVFILYCTIHFTLIATLVFKLKATFLEIVIISMLISFLKYEHKIFLAVIKKHI